MYRDVTLIKQASLQDTAVGLCLWPYDGLREKMEGGKGGHFPMSKAPSRVILLHGRAIRFKTPRCIFITVMGNVQFWIMIGFDFKYPCTYM